MDVSLESTGGQQMNNTLGNSKQKEKELDDAYFLGMNADKPKKKQEIAVSRSLSNSNISMQHPTVKVMSMTAIEEKMAKEDYN